MKLTIFVNQAFYYDVLSKSFTNLSFFKFIESFETAFDEIAIIAPTKIVNDATVHGNYQCKGTISLKPIPYFHNVKDMAKKIYYIFPKTKKVLEYELLDTDILWIVSPHPLSILAWLCADKLNVKAFLHIRGNILNDVSARYRGSLIGLLYANYIHFSNKLLSRKIPTMTVGRELYDMYRYKARKLYWISPSLITQEDINETRKALPAPSPSNAGEIKLLFVGRVEPEKGLNYLFEALKELNQNGTKDKYLLTVVGGAQRGSEHKEAEIKNFAKKIEIEKFIQWKGYVPFGDELKEIYRAADIFILPSLAEGIPKVIYEAMAFGLPVVSTDVGGIPDIIQSKKNGLLIKPKSKNEIKLALKTLVQQNDFKEMLINNGLTTAEKYTIESSMTKLLSIFYP